MFLRCITHNSGPYVKGEIMKFVKTLAKLWLIAILILIVIIIFFLCPVGLMIVSIIRHSLCYFLGGLIWLITSSALVVFEEDEVKRIIKEEFNK